MPFNPFRRKPVAAASPAVPGSPPPPGRPVAFEGLTEEWRLVGTMHLEGRLSDALNRREPIAISAMTWGPADPSALLEPAAGLRSVDPYDLILVMARPDSLPVLTDAEKVAFKVHKVPFDVGLEVPPFRVVGTIYLYPGTDPSRLMDRSTEMFVAVSDAQAFLGERQLDAEAHETILVNRFYLRGVAQIDRRTMSPVQPLPGMPLGGTSWQDRSR